MSTQAHNNVVADREVLATVFIAMNTLANTSPLKDIIERQTVPGITFEAPDMLAG